MKICYLADGESVHTRRWCAHFASLGHDIHLITFRNVQLEYAKVHFVDAGEISVEGGNKKVLLKVPAVKKLLREIRPDILHAHYATSYGIVGALTRFHPYVITALGSDVLVSPKNSRLYRVALRYAFRRADWITGMAPHMRDEMIRIGADPAKTTVVPFGVDLGIFNTHGRGTGQDTFVLTSTRNFEPVYNIPDLLHAIAAIKSEIPRMQVNLVGDGSMRGQLEELAKRLGIAGICTFYGRIPQREIADILRKTDVFVTVSSSDGNNISLNEAMACGAYCIATDIPANRQWITNDVNGTLVPVNQSDVLAEKIFFVSRHLDELQSMAQKRNMDIITEHANWHANMLKVEEKYKQLTTK